MKFSDSKITLDRSWKLTPKTSILIITGIIVILGISFFIWKQKELPPPQAEIQPVLLSFPQGAEEILKPGAVGEVSKEDAAEIPTGYPEFPPVIFNTSGKILEVKEDRIIVQGSGSNFADQASRTLNVLFASSTITFEQGQKVKYQGAGGLKFLKAGMEISIEGIGNIRGKTEFVAQTIYP